MDRSLMEAFEAVERSKHTDNSDLLRIWKKLKSKEQRVPTDYENDYLGDPMYSLPYSGHYNRFNRYSNWI